MKDKNKINLSQLINVIPDSYFERTARPVYSIIFLLPFIAFYEFGTVFINTDVLKNYWQGRVVAFLWLQKSLEYIGFTNKFAWLAPPFLVIVILIAMQLTSRKKWRVWPRDFIFMTIEGVLFSIPLLVLGLFLNSSHTTAVTASQQNLLLPAAAVSNCSSTIDNQLSRPATRLDDTQKKSIMADIITGIGAGIYEELVFRLILICLLMFFFQDLLRLEHKNAVIWSILISAALFSVHHHIDFFSGQLNPVDTFSFTKFLFRTTAGVYFAFLFAARGFGITVGAHAFYDIIATLINYTSFSS